MMEEEITVEEDIKSIIQDIGKSIRYASDLAFSTENAIDDAYHELRSLAAYIEEHILTA